MLSRIAQAMRRLSPCDLPEMKVAPPITLTDIEHRRLNVLAMAGSGHDATASDRMYWELDRARIVPEAELAAGTVRMGSIVSYRTDGGVVGNITLVYPDQADSSGRTSILTPLGTALIGVSVGDSIPWSFEDGRPVTLTVTSVSGP
ncbi:MAG: GreA/GreB family elongation factor [Devosia sp.]|uniref:GreA/GreB family elongation factor n=1 Tax=Devosia sp. TaxID=1871048 RepID=UPI001AC20C98|nr:GreA/GreB family elongation factor [Devosia sp.]MBN9314583.1 GreA/GreB family elongation factor [Devosia sp.]